MSARPDRSRVKGVALLALIALLAALVLSACGGGGSSSSSSSSESSGATETESESSGAAENEGETETAAAGENAWCGEEGVTLAALLAPQRPGRHVEQRFPDGEEQKFVLRQSPVADPA